MRRGEAETKGKEKVTAGKKWRNEIKDREIKLKRGSGMGSPFRSEEHTDREERKVEVKVRGDKRFSSNEQNVNLCSDQRASQ